MLVVKVDFDNTLLELVDLNVQSVVSDVQLLVYHLDSVVLSQQSLNGL